MTLCYFILALTSMFLSLIQRINMVCDIVPICFRWLFPISNCTHRRLIICQYWISICLCLGGRGLVRYSFSQHVYILTFKPSSNHRLVQLMSFETMDSNIICTICFFTTMLCLTEISGSVNIRDILCGSCSNRTCPVIRSPCELVREPGLCSCCLKCAIDEGENCGINLGRCRRGLRCRPLPDDPDPFHALRIGRAICQSIPTNRRRISASQARRFNRHPQHKHINRYVD